MRTTRPLLVALLLFLPLASDAADPPSSTPDEEEHLPIHLTDEEKTRLHEIGIRHVDTPPPTGKVRNPAEWEPSEGVLVRWPLGVTVALIAELSEDVMVTTIVSGASAEQSARDSA